MTAYSRVLTIGTTTRRQLVDITNHALKFVEDCEVRDGLLTVCVPHATAAVVANENERGLQRDILARIEALFPQSSEYAHNRIDDNADSHLAATFLGHTRSFIIKDHQLVRGTWQNIFLVELDGPRTRREVYFSIVG